MNKRVVLAVFLSVFLSSSIFGMLFIVPVKSHPADIIVPDDYEKIQWAIGNASDGDTIFVKAGTYYEHVVVNKTVSLIGENRSTTIIDGNRTWDPVIRIVADNVTITGFTLQSGGPYGIGLYLCENARGNVVHGNIISNNADGILIWSSNNNTIFNNLITSNWIHGLLLAYSVNNTLKSNNLTENPYNFGVMGNLLEHFIHNVDTSNTVNGKPIYYWVNQADKQIPIDAGYVGIINSTHITAKDLALTNNWQGILLAYTTNSIIHNVNINNSWKGIYLYNQDAYGNNTISNNILFKDAWGIELSRSSGNAIQNNKIISNNELYGICLDSSNANAISGNNVSNFRIGLHLGYSDNNTIMGNSIANSRTYGIRFYNSSRNIIYHNNFINNTQQVYIESYYNIWDDGYPSGGNYWSDYSGVDVKSGPNQDQPSSDGIGDTAYVVDANNTDNYPLIYPWGGPPPPSYTLTIYSSPTGVTFTVDGVSRTTPWSGTYSEGASVSLVMPETRDGYLWSHWLEDGDTNRTKTVTMDTDITLTAVYTRPPPPPPVGGKAIPINKPIIKPELSIPWIWLSTIILLSVTTVVFVKLKKKKQ